MRRSLISLLWLSLIVALCRTQSTITGSAASGLQCTANDVTLSGPGIILNEPCQADCVNGMFNAEVAFPVQNNAGADRFCGIVHLCDFTFNGIKYTFNRIALNGPILANRINNLTATITNYPCGAGLQCSGAASPTNGDLFAKGENCPTGQCCSTVSWDVNAPKLPATCTSELDDKVIGSKCRHQRICIQGRGVTLKCTSTNCNPTCGGTVTVQLCDSTGRDATNFVFTLTADTSSTVITAIPPASLASPCRSYDVRLSESTILTGNLNDGVCAATTATLPFTVNPLASPTLSVSTPSCAGVVTISVTNCATIINAGGSLKIDVTKSSTGTSATIKTCTSCPCSDTRTWDSAGDYVISATSSTGTGCGGSTPDSFHINPPLSVTLDNNVVSDCLGRVTFSASASGGGSDVTKKSLTWQFDNGTPTNTITPGSFSIPSSPFNVCHLVSVFASDTSNPAETCTTPKSSLFVKQCVQSTVSSTCA